MANRARVLHLPGVSGLLPLQGFGLWFVWASGICSPRACCLRGTDAPTPVVLGGEPRQALVLVVIYQGDKGGEDNTARFEKGVIGCACFQISVVRLV